MLDFLTLDLDARPRETRVLSVCGGGLLGVIPASMLVRLEALGIEAYGNNYRLSDSFDLVGGTSTGAVIATGVALGLSAAEIANFYLRDVPNGFRRRTTSIPFLHDTLDADLLETHFVNGCNGQALTRTSLECDLAIVVKDIAQSQPIAFTTFPTAEREILGAEILHDALPLSKLLRASTAAPGLFSAVPIKLDCGKEILAIDGGLSPFNNPSQLMAQMAMSQSVTGIDLVSLGTGSSRPRNSSQSLRRAPAILRALTGLKSMIKDAEVHCTATMDMLARASGAYLSYRHIDMDLSNETLRGLDRRLSRTELRDMRNFADFRGKERLFELASLHAETAITQPLPLAEGKTSILPE